MAKHVYHLVTMQGAAGKPWFLETCWWPESTWTLLQPKYTLAMQLYYLMQVASLSREVHQSRCKKSPRCWLGLQLGHPTIPSEVCFFCLSVPPLTAQKKCKQYLAVSLACTVNMKSHFFCVHLSASARILFMMVHCFGFSSRLYKQTTYGPWLLFSLSKSHKVKPDLKHEKA